MAAWTCDGLELGRVMGLGPEFLMRLVPGLVVGLEPGLLMDE